MLEFSNSGMAGPLSLPAGGTVSDVKLTSDSCGGGDCAVVGSFVDSSTGYSEGLLIGRTSSGWTVDALCAGGVISATVCASGSGNPSASVAAVACATGGCRAVGTGAGGKASAFSFETSGWTSSQLVLPAGGGGTQFSAISCSSVANCAAVGTYADASGTEGLLATLSSGAWSTKRAPLPANANAHHVVGLQSVSCPSATACNAVGEYVDTTSHQDVLEMSGSVSGSWAAAEITLSGTGAANPHASATSVSCAVAAWCVAGGTYSNSSGATQGFILDDVGGIWSASVAPLPPGAAASPGASIATVDCASVATCDAIGNYTTANGTQDVVAESLSRPAPAISKLSPTSGPTTGGTSVTISGSGFRSATGITGVKFGKVAARSTKVVSDSEIIALSPPESASRVTVSVTSQFGTSAADAAASFVYKSGAAASAAARTRVIAHDSSMAAVAPGVAPVDRVSMVPIKLPLPGDVTTTADPNVKIMDESCDGSVACMALATYMNGQANVGSAVLIYYKGQWSASSVGGGVASTAGAVTCFNTYPTYTCDAVVPTGQSAAFFGISPPYAVQTSFSLPSGGSISDASVKSMACAGAECVAVGSFKDDSTGFTEGLLLQGRAGLWGAEAVCAGGVISATVCSAGGGNPNFTLSSVSCPETGCLAVGSGNGVPYSFTLAGSWSASPIPVPAGGANASFSTVTCSTNADCIAVGDYDDPHGTDGLIGTWIYGSWVTFTAPLAANSSATHDVSLGGVACPTASTCTAAGQYHDSSSRQQMLALAGGVGAGWSAISVPPPAGAGSNPMAMPSAVSCVAKSWCEVSGTYADAGGVTHGYLASEAGGTWSSVASALPAGAAGTAAAGLARIDCSSAETCTAVGTYTASNGYHQGMANLITPSAPKIVKLSPATGSSAGATSVTITGSGFESETGATGVKFGTVAAKSIRVVSDDEIIAVSPAHPAGTVSISVTSQFGTSSANSATMFVYKAA
jgi:hypothetical protein